MNVRVNDSFEPYFPASKGLMHGDHTSPLLFDLSAEALPIIMKC